MPIRIPDALPAAAQLESENIFVMTEYRALHQDIRPLRVLILNLMPTKIVTETQLLRVIGNTPLQVEVTFLRTASHLSRNTVKRGFIVLACGAAVSIVTAVIMPAIGIEGAEIYFGILSCLGCCMIIGGLLQRPLKKCPAGIGMLICVLLFILTYSVSAHSLLFGLIKLPDSLYKSNLLCPLGFFGDDFFSADYFPLLPWLFMFLTGAFIGRYAEAGAFPEALYKSRCKFLQKAGKNSLWIYLLHQPALYAIMYIISFIMLLAL